MEHIILSACGEEQVCPSAPNMRMYTNTQVKYAIYLSLLTEKHRFIHIFLLGKSLLSEC